MAVSIFDEKSEEELWLEFKKTRSPELRDAFIRKYMPLVKYVAGKVATGMPGGIITIESNASWPWRVESIGRPITGSGVRAAITPGRAAAIPAA